MIPKKAIERAIEGGWQPSAHRSRTLYNTATRWLQEAITVSASISEAEIALDPSFWQSLGKALGWSEEDFEGFIHKDDDMLCPCNPEKLVQSGAMIVLHRGPVRWRTEAHNFFGIILTGGDTEKFWSDLLGSQSDKEGV